MILLIILRYLKSPGVDLKNCLVFLVFALFASASNAQSSSKCIFDPAGIDYDTLQKSQLLSDVKVDTAQHLVRANFGANGVLLAKFYTCNEYGVSANLLLDESALVSTKGMRSHIEKLTSLFLQGEALALFKKALRNEPNSKLKGQIAFSNLASRLGFSALNIQITQQGEALILGFSYAGN